MLENAIARAVEAGGEDGTSSSSVGQECLQLLTKYGQSTLKAILCGLRIGMVS